LSLLSTIHHHCEWNLLKAFLRDVSLVRFFLTLRMKKTFFCDENCEKNCGWIVVWGIRSKGNFLKVNHCQDRIIHFKSIFFLLNRIELVYLSIFLYCTFTIHLKNEMKMSGN
jgi:hypothetical protein